MGEQFRKFKEWVAKGDPKYNDKIALENKEKEIAVLQSDLNRAKGNRKLMGSQSPDIMEGNWAIDPTNAEIAMADDLAKENEKKLALLQQQRRDLMQKLGRSEESL